MITESFDDKSEAIINPIPNKNRVKCDICIATFSNLIEKHILNTFEVNKIGTYKCVNGVFPVHIFEYKGKVIAIYKSLLGAPASVAALEEVSKILDFKRLLVFGSSGTLNKELCHNKVVVPTYAYRDEGTSYHYAKAENYIEIKNANIVAEFMERNNIPFSLGKCWTTDAFYRETRNNFQKRRDEGCLVVDMECSAMQAVCNFRNINLYYFLLPGDMLDAPKWDNDKRHDANHHVNNFDIALQLAMYIVNKI